jgi:parafibromin
MKSNPNLSPRRATSESMQQSSNFDPELSSFFLVRRNSNSHSTTFDSGSSAVSPLFGSRARTYQRSQRSQRSGESYRIHHGKNVNSASSAVSISNRHPNFTDWNNRRKSDFSGPDSCASTQRHSVDPPRPPREGMEWVWFPEGYWAERERVEIDPKREQSPKKWFNRSAVRKSSNSTHKTAAKSVPFTTVIDVPRVQTGSLRRQTDTSDKASSKRSDSNSHLSKVRRGLSFISPTYPHFISPSGQPEGLYCKTRRNVEGRFVQRPKLVRPEFFENCKTDCRKSLDDSALDSEGGLAPQTTVVLEGASSYFERAQRERNQRHEALASPATSCGPASPGSRSRRFGLAPWHRRTSHESLFSVTSSVHKLLMGKTPAATPNPAGAYTGQDGKSYPKGTDQSSLLKSQPADESFQLKSPTPTDMYLRFSHQ